MGYPISGLFLLIWGSINTYFNVQDHGWSGGTYWWFCNLALFGMGVGLFIRSRGLITAFLSIATYTQSLWLVDNIYRQSTGLSLFGLTDHMYQADYSLSRFVLSHYHYFTLLVGFYALLYLPRTTNHTLKLIIILNPLIFVISYFVFPASQNINCIHRSCLPSLIPGSSRLFSFLFWFVMFVAHLGMAYFIDQFFFYWNPKPAQSRLIKGLLILGFLSATGLSLHDVNYRLNMPRLVCSSPEYVDGLEIQCRSLKPLSASSSLLVYSILNRSQEIKQCQVFFEKEGKSIEAGLPFNLSSGQELIQEYPVEKPATNTLVQVRPRCKRSLDAQSAQQ